MSISVDRLFRLVFHEGLWLQTRTQGDTHPFVVKVFDHRGEILFLKDDEGHPVKVAGHPVPATVELYNSLLGQDVKAGKLSPDEVFYIDLEGIDSDSLEIDLRYMIQRGRLQVLSAKRNPDRILVTDNVRYYESVKARFAAPQSMIAYGKYKTTSYEKIMDDSFLVKFVEEGVEGTADGQSRASTKFLRELGYRRGAQVQFRLETLEWIASGTLLSTDNRKWDMIIPTSSVKGWRGQVGLGEIELNGRLGIIKAARPTEVRNNFEFQHFCKQLAKEPMERAIDELRDAQKDPRAFLEHVHAPSKTDNCEDVAVVNAVLRATVHGRNSEESDYMSQALMSHPWIRRRVYDRILAQYREVALSGGHKFAGYYLAACDQLEPGSYWAPGVSGDIFMFRIPLLAGSGVQPFKRANRIPDELADAYGTVFIHPTDADRINSDFDMDLVCIITGNDPYFPMSQAIYKAWGNRDAPVKPDRRKASKWNRFGVGDAVTDFVTAPNIGQLTLLQHNAVQAGASVPDILTLGKAIQVAVSSPKWQCSLPPKEQDQVDKMARRWGTSRAPHLKAAEALRQGPVDLEEYKLGDTPLDHQVRAVATALTEAKEEVGQVLAAFSPGSFIGFLGLSSEEAVNDLKVVAKAYNKAVGRLLERTKADSRNRLEGLRQLAANNRRFWAGLRDREDFRDLVRAGWDVAHALAARSRHGSTASFIWSAGVHDTIVELLRDQTGSKVGRISPKDNQETSSLLVVQGDTSTLKPGCKIKVGSTKDGKVVFSTTGIPRLDVVTDIDLGLGEYEVESIEEDMLLVHKISDTVFTKITLCRLAAYHRTAKEGIDTIQGLVGSECKVVPGDRGFDFMVRSETLASVMANKSESEVFLGTGKIVRTIFNKGVTLDIIVERR